MICFALLLQLLTQASPTEIIFSAGAPVSAIQFEVETPGIFSKVSPGPAAQVASKGVDYAYLMTENVYRVLVYGLNDFDIPSGVVATFEAQGPILIKAVIFSNPKGDRVPQSPTRLEIR